MSPPAPGTAREVLPAYLVRGSDGALAGQAVRELLEVLVAGRDPALVVEEHGGPSTEDLSIAAVIDAVTTPPFLVDRRVVVVREAGRLTAADAARLAEVLAHPLDGVVVVLAGGGGTIPAALVKAVTAVGEVRDVSVVTPRDRQGWLDARLRGGPVRLTGPAAARVGAHLGEDLGRLAGLLQTLADAYGTGATLDVAEVEPFLGTAGSVPPWELTDAIDAGQGAVALEVLHRMTGAGGRSAPEIVALLDIHYSNMLRLDGHDTVTPEEAARILGARSTYPARKALEQCRRLGSARVAEAIGLVADADLDVKGRSGLDLAVVLDIVVARLSRLSRVRPARPARGR